MKLTKLDLGHETLSNCYILTDEDTGKSAIVDPGYFTDVLKDYIDDEKLDVQYILLTHGHFDHIMGDKDTSDYTGAQVVIHEDDAICLKSKEYNLMNMFGVEAKFDPMEPHITVKDGDILHLGNTEIKVMATPGHSKGGVLYIFEKDRVIISGDTLFRSTVGRTDAVGSDHDEMVQSIKRILNLEGNYKIYPGHGPETDLDHERTRNIFIRRMGL